ncbi:MAG: DUF4177 domain-containing protein [Oscillospiraceae bacterium]|jgi:hypothetical protein|nr:DUF4177 domain-containing protein [Oscillospiraceae bacterium]
MQWEYKTLNFTPLEGDDEYITNMFNSFGAEKWELVSCFTTTDGFGTRIIRAVFKRPKQ